MDKSHSLSSHMVVCLLEVNKCLFCPKEYNVELLDPKVANLNAICVLMYFANCIRTNIAFYAHLLARYGFAST